MIKKNLIGIFVILFIISGIYFFRKNPNFKKSDELIIGTSSGYAPFVSINSQGEYEGFDIDFAKELCKRLNKKCVLSDLGSMPSLWMALNQNKIDMIIWAISITKERDERYQMIHYQGQPTKALPLLFWKQIPQGIQTIEDFKKYPDAIVSVEPASSLESFLSKFDFIKLKPMEKVSDLIMDIKYGKSIATMVDPSLVSDLKEKYPDIVVLWVTLPQDWVVNGNGVALTKDKIELGEQIRQAVEQMKQDGTIKRLENKWSLIWK